MKIKQFSGIVAAARSFNATYQILSFEPKAYIFSESQQMTLFGKAGLENTHPLSLSEKLKVAHTDSVSVG